jgi:hypothetical protein
LNVLEKTYQFLEKNNFNLITIASDGGKPCIAALKRFKEMYLNVFIFYEYDHLLKTIRNHFYNDDYTINNKSLRWDILQYK